MTAQADRGTLAFASAALLASAWGVLPSVTGLLTFSALAALFTAPGWPVARWVGGDGCDAVTRGTLALVFGYVAGATVCCALRLAGVSTPLAVLAATGLCAAACAWILRGPQDGVVSLVRLTLPERVGVSALWLLTLAIVGPVFARVGQPVADGLAYRAYFNADLFAHMSVVAELVKGATPPINPFFPTEPLPYYWTYFTLPALFAELQPTLLVDRGILLTDIGAGLALVGVAFIVTRNLGASALATVVAWTTILVASSFEGAYLIWLQLSRGRSIDAFRFTNVDAITRWYWHLPAVDGLHRAMWWTQQHEVAITLALILLLVHVRARRPDSVGAGVVEGVMLGAALAISSFNGLLLVAWYALAQVLVLALMRPRHIVSWIVARSTAAVIVLGFLGLTLGLGMVQRTPGAFIWGWNEHFLRGPWRFVLLSFGPGLFLAPLGVAACIRASGRLAAACAVVVAVCTAAFLLVDLRGHENTYVTFRTGHLIFVVLAVVLAFAIDAWRRWPTAGRMATATLWLLGVVAAVPTVAFDWYNARDTSNVAISPGGFPWTMRISHDDQAAIEWVRSSVAADAHVQTDGSASARARTEWAFVTAFLGRRMGVGSGIFELNPLRFDPMLDEIHAAYSTADARYASDVFRRYDVDFVYVGDVERAKDAPGIAKFAAHPDLFPRVFAHGSAEIFAVRVPGR